MSLNFLNHVIRLELLDFGDRGKGGAEVLCEFICFWISSNGKKQELLDILVYQPWHLRTEEVNNEVYGKDYSAEPCALFQLLTLEWITLMLFEE